MSNRGGGGRSGGPQVDQFEQVQVVVTFGSSVNRLRQTHMSKNITLRQTTYASGNEQISEVSLKMGSVKFTSVYQVFIKGFATIFEQINTENIWKPWFISGPGILCIHIERNYMRVH